MRWYLKPWPAQIISSPALITPLPVNRFPNKVAPKVPINILRNPPFCSFASFLIVSLTYFINKHYSLRDLTTFMISFISSLEIINGVVPDLNIFLWIAASVTDADRVNPNGIKTLLANGLNSCSIKCYPVFSNVLKVYLIILLIVLFCAIQFFIIFSLADELFSKALRSLKSCVFCSNSLCRKLL